MHLSLPSGGGPFQDGSPSLNASAEAALNLWNAELVRMKFAVDRDSRLPPSQNDADTSVLMSSTIYGDAFGPRVLAVTLVSRRNSTLMEADVIFNNALEFDSYRGPSQGAVYDFRRVALHEFGHVLGLLHPDQANPKQNVTAIMNSVITSIDSLQFDDIAGAHFLYGGDPSSSSARPGPNLLNLSTRAFVGTGDKVLIGGFIIQGTQPTTVVLRAIGHSLAAVGITDALDDPYFELHAADGSVLASSDDWIENADASTIAGYHLDPPNSRESAVFAVLNPGSYTVVVRAFDNDDGKLTGTGVVELYDLHSNNMIPSSPGRAGNISTRGQVLAGDRVLIGGFIVGGSQTKEIVARALGPSLAGSNIANPLSDPTLELRDGSGNLLAANDNWSEANANSSAIQAEGLAPNEPAESALQATLNPGSYTAIVRSGNGTPGIGLVEIYDLSPPPN